MVMRRKMFIFLLICGVIPIVISIGMLVAARFSPGVDRFLSKDVCLDQGGYWSDKDGRCLEARSPR